ncbi:MAG: site-specific integrase [Actinobacteria bacterium]|nr:site-specific integrase [Actinomycetota bacterium]
MLEPISEFPRQLSFRDVVEDWRARQLYRQTTVDLATTLLRNHILPAFGDRPIRSIRPGEVQAWVRDRSAVLAPSTVDVAFRFLSSICATAVVDGHIERTPCEGIKLPRIERPPIVPPTPDEVHAITAEIIDRYRAPVVLAAGTGLRSGECFGLGLEALDFDAAVVRVERQLVLPDTGPPRLGPPKTRASYRTVPLPSVVADTVHSHLERYGPGPESLVFGDPRGTAVRRYRFNEAWRRAVTAAGLTRRVRFHDLRHFYASLLISHGESVKVVQARLGHASATETLDTYAHLWPDDGDRTRRAVDSILGDL